MNATNLIQDRANSAQSQENVRLSKHEVQIEQFPFGYATKRFLNIASCVYHDDPQWVQPLNLDLSDRLNPKKNPFFEHADGITLIASINGVDVGRATAQIDYEHLKRYNDAVGFFGFLDTINHASVSKALLDEAAIWLKQRGMKKMRGPLSLSINEEVGVLVEGFDTPPAILMPHHRPYQATLIEAAGLTKEKDFFAWHYDVGDVPIRSRKAHDEITKMPEVKLRTVSLKNVDRDIRIVIDVFNEAWSDNWGFVPFTENELKKMASDMKLLLVPDLALIAEVNGEPAAISVALPNINEMIRDLKGKLFPLGLLKLLYRLKVRGAKSARLALLGIKKKFRDQRRFAGLSAALYVAMNDRAHKLGYQWGELSWTVEDNVKVSAGIRLMGGRIYKKYRLYSREL